jgi:hypothetical protein
MKQNLNEEVARMREMMGIDEQMFKGLGDKLKTVAGKAGQAIQTGVHNVAQKVADVTQKQGEITNPTNSQNKGRDYNQLKTEWSKINTDTTNTKGFGEGVSKDMNIAKQMGEMNARAAMLKKMGKNEASFGSSIVDEATFQNQDGTYNYLVVLDLNQ